MLSDRFEQEEGIDTAWALEVSVPLHVYQDSLFIPVKSFSHSRLIPSKKPTNLIPTRGFFLGVREVQFGKGTETGSHFIAWGGLDLTR